jgi:hypothetical protein
MAYNNIEAPFRAQRLPRLVSCGKEPLDGEERLLRSDAQQVIGLEATLFKGLGRCVMGPTLTRLA